MTEKILNGKKNGMLFLPPLVLLYVASLIGVAFGGMMMDAGESPVLFIISIIYAVVAGVMFMLSEKFVSHSGTEFTLGTSLNILAIVIIGGMKSIWGAIFGTFLIYGVKSMFLINIPFFRENSDFIGIFSGILVILVVMFYPGGLSQLMLETKFKIAKLRTKIREAKYGKDLG